VAGLAIYADGTVMDLNINRRIFLGLAASLAAIDSAAEPNFSMSSRVALSTPESSIQQSFGIAARLVEQMRRLAFAHYQKDGWLAVSDGKNGPQHSYDPRDFRYGPKCAAYLYGHDPAFSLEMGSRIFEDQTDPATGRLLWDPKGQTSIHLAQTVKHYSDYLVYSGQDAFVQKHWARLVQMLKWNLEHYDTNHDGLIEHGPNVPDHLWALLVGEPDNFPVVDHCGRDAVVVSSMEVCELLSLAANYGVKHGLAETAWIQQRAAQTKEAIEKAAWDPDAANYYLLYRAPEKRWYHSLLGINEDSRELDVTPYYSSLISGNHSRAAAVAAYARKVLLEYSVFPMPLHYPTYCWLSPNYSSAYGGIPGGCWEEGYYNCVRSWSNCKMLDAVQEAVRRRSNAYVRDNDCEEWYTQAKGAARGRDRYGISAAGHVSAVIEGLFGITPTGFGFDEMNLWPNVPATWTDAPSSITVTLPADGYLQLTHLYEPARKVVSVSAETDKERLGHFRVYAPTPVKQVKWNGEHTRYVSAEHPGGGFFVYLDRRFQHARLEIELLPFS
jgi:hypothetical protein